MAKVNTITDDAPAETGIHRVVYTAFRSGPAIVCNRFTLWTVMALALAVLLGLAFGGYRNSIALSRLRTLAIVILVIGVFLVAGILAAMHWDHGPLFSFAVSSHRA